MRLQVLPYAASLSLCTCRMPWQGAGREVEEGQGRLKSLLAIDVVSAAAWEYPWGMGLDSPSAPRNTKELYQFPNLLCFRFLNFLLLSLPQLWFYHTSTSSHHYHFNCAQTCAHPSPLAETLSGPSVTNGIETCHFITQH